MYLEDAVITARIRDTRFSWFASCWLLGSLLLNSLAAASEDEPEFWLGGKRLDASKTWSSELVDKSPPAPPDSRPEPTEDHPKAADNLLRSASHSEDDLLVPPHAEVLSRDLDFPAGTANSFPQASRHAGSAAMPAEIGSNNAPPAPIVIVQPVPMPGYWGEPPPRPVAEMVEPRPGPSESLSVQLVFIAAGFAVGVLLSFVLFLLPLVYLVRRKTTERPVHAHAPGTDVAAGLQMANAMPNGKAIGHHETQNVDEFPRMLPFPGIESAFQQQRDKEEQHRHEQTQAILKMVLSENLAFHDQIHQLSEAA